MSRAAGNRLRVLHAVVLRGHGDAEAIGALAGTATADAEPTLADLAADGLVAPARGVLSGWIATPAGRAEHRRLLAAELDEAGAREKVAATYERFRVLNRQLLQACTDWQVRDGRPNDHRDAAYDSATVARLHELHRSLQPVLDDLEACLDRYSAYRPRLAHALERIDAGERDWFTKPMIDSYHTVWFQLHEDLLATLGLERSNETQEEEGM